MSTIYPVILAGGASSRLWPVSDACRPKWDLRLFGPQSLLEEAWARARSVADPAHCVVVAGPVHEKRIRASLPELPKENLLLEPEPRDTAGAVAFAAGVVAGRDPSGSLLILPGDHVISPLERFAKCARAAQEAGRERRALVAFGIVARSPATGYGYIQRGEIIPLKTKGDDAPWAFHVRSFKEKPSKETAEAYLQSGEYFWNGGIFLFPLPVLMHELERQLPGHATLARELAAAKDVRAVHAAANKYFPTLKKTSIDYGIMEHAPSVAGVAADFQWDDIGSWSAVTPHLPKQGNNVTGPDVDLEAIESDGNVVMAKGRRVALVGVSGLAIIEDEEGILICKLDKDQMVKEVSQRMQARKRDTKPVKNSKTNVRKRS